MSTPSKSIQEHIAAILEEMRGWPGVTEAPRSSTDDVTLVKVDRDVLARVHDDGRIEIPFPRPVGEKLVASGRAERHHALPDSGWVIVRLEGADPLSGAIEVLRLAHQVRRPDATLPEGPLGEVARSARHFQKKIDESVEETFPASDPPASGRD